MTIIRERRRRCDPRGAGRSRGGTDGAVCRGDACERGEITGELRLPSSSLETVRRRSRKDGRRSRKDGLLSRASCADEPPTVRTKACSPTVRRFVKESSSCEQAGGAGADATAPQLAVAATAAPLAAAASAASSARTRSSRAAVRCCSLRSSCPGSSSAAAAVCCAALCSGSTNDLERESPDPESGRSATGALAAAADDIVDGEEMETGDCITDAGDLVLLSTPLAVDLGLKRTPSEVDLGRRDSSGDCTIYSLVAGS